MRSRRFPAEWELQDGVLISWPHKNSDWAMMLDRIEAVFIRIVKQIGLFESVTIVCPEPSRLELLLKQSGVEMANVEMILASTNDVWARDFGPVTVFEGGEPVFLDFDFNGWGLKHPFELDNAVNCRLQEAGFFGRHKIHSPGFILEGGSIDTDGQGTLLTSSRCLLSANRNAHLSRADIEFELKKSLGVSRVLWLQHGYLAGDDTDGHIDFLARFCPGHTIAYIACDDPNDEHFEEMAKMREELFSFRNGAVEAYKLVPLPWPQPKYDSSGRRLPVSYANFVVINGAVLVPAYRDQADAKALSIVDDLFPGREAIGIDCLDLIEQGGALHCLTMQLQAGTRG